MTWLGNPWPGGGVGGTIAAGAPTALSDLNPEVIPSCSLNNVPLVNGTPTLLATTVCTPNDGNNHLVIAIMTADVTATETGGGCTVTFTNANGHTVVTTVFGGGSTGPAIVMGVIAMAVLSPGATVSAAQSSALTAGTANVSLRVLYV